MSDKKGLTPQQRKHIEERLKAHERKITWGRDRPVMTAPDDVKKAMGIVRAWERKAEAAAQKRGFRIFRWTGRCAEQQMTE